MNAAHLYSHLQDALGPELKPSKIGKGKSFFWQEKKTGRNSTRVLRVHQNASGNVSEIKLPVTSLRNGKMVHLLPLPTSLDVVLAATRREIDLLKG
jgi:hypothetical protein